MSLHYIKDRVSNALNDLGLARMSDAFARLPWSEQLVIIAALASLESLEQSLHKTIEEQARRGEAGIPTIKLDLNGMKASLVGQSEERLRAVIKGIEAVDARTPAGADLPNPDDLIEEMASAYEAWDHLRQHEVGDAYQISQRIIAAREALENGVAALQQAREAAEEQNADWAKAWAQRDQVEGHTLRTLGVQLAEVQKEQALLLQDRNLFANQRDEYKTQLAEARAERDRISVREIAARTEGQRVTDLLAAAQSELAQLAQRVEQAKRHGYRIAMDLMQSELFRNPEDDIRAAVHYFTLGEGRRGHA